MKKTLKYVTLSVATLILGIILILVYLSPKKTTPFPDAPNSIAVIDDLEINGSTQRILIRGKNLNNPVLLHLHGGPGAPDHAFWQHYGLDIEDLFTVCYWDQRGAGASYHKDIDPSTMTLDQLADDGIALAGLLAKRFDKEKIFLQGHSFGTAVATYMAQKSPNRFHAYIGIGQMANKLLAEQRSYDFALEQSISNKNLEDENKLKEIGRPPYASDEATLQAVFVERPIMRKYENPYDNNPLSMLDIYKIFASYREYSIGDKIRAIQGDPFSMSNLWVSIRDADFKSQFPSWDLPVYIIQGKYDQHTVTSVAKEFFEGIEAPSKEYFEFDKSAHNPHLNDQERYRGVLRSILNKN